MMQPWSRVLVMVSALLLMLIGGGAEAQDDTDEGSSSASCQGRWWGFAYEKVKAGDEHCGVLERTRKDGALDAACALAGPHAERLAAEAEAKAWSQVEALGKQEICSCTGILRTWENVFTHVFSQRCWTECGQAFVIECEPLKDPTE